MFGERIRELRKNQGLTQEELGKELGLSKQTVSNWENNNIMPSIEVLIDIADLFQVSTDYILEKNDTLTLDITDLNPEQQALTQRIVNYFRNSN